MMPSSETSTQADCTLLTWNVWWQFGDWRERQLLVETAVTAAGADVITLQESFRGAGHDQPAAIAAACGYEHVAWSPSPYSHRWRDRVAGSPDDLDCGLAVVSRWPFLAVEQWDLPAGRWRSTGRTALAVVVDRPGSPLPVVTTHLDSNPARSELRVEQLSSVARRAVELQNTFGSTAVVSGDMNAEPESDEIRKFAGVLTAPFVDDEVFLDAWRIAGPDGDPGWTWRRDNPLVPPGHPDARIDYIFIGSGGRVLSVSLVGRGEHDSDQWPSDHLGVLATFRT
jgi:endonuclease/exonuclease/phosphatase family metal-dependent hydrolase